MTTCCRATSSPRAAGRPRPRSRSIDDAVPAGLVPEHPRDRLDDRVEVERLHLHLAFAGEPPHALNHLARPPVVAPDVAENLAHLLELSVSRREQHLGGLGVGEDRAEGLIDLVRDRGRELPHRRQARRLRELLLAPPVLLLRAPPLPALDEQCDQEGRLGGHGGGPAEDPVPVGRPERRRAIPDLVRRRHGADRDPEALQRPRVHSENARGARDERDRAGSLAPQHAQRDLTGRVTLVGRIEQGAPGDSAPEVRGVDGEDRHGGRRGEGARRIERNDRPARRVPKHHRVDEDGVGGQSAELLREIGDRDAGASDHIQPDAELLHVATHALHRPDVEGSGARDDHDPARPGNEALGQLEGLGHVVVAEEARDPVGPDVVREVRRFDGGEHHGRMRPEAVPVRRQKI